MRKLPAIVALCSGVLALSLNAVPAQAVPRNCTHGVWPSGPNVAWGKCTSGTGTQRVVVDCRTHPNKPSSEVRYYGAFVAVGKVSTKACPALRPFAVWTTVWPRN
jgi:hypothetical protein